MQTPSPLPPPGSSPAITPSAAPVGQSLERPSESSQAQAGVAFQALLDRLDAQARELEQKGSAVDDAELLAGAMSTARDSLAGALSLGDQLLEAYREALHQPEPPAAHDASVAAPDSSAARGSEG